MSADGTRNISVGQQAPNNSRAGAKNPLLKCHICAATLKTMNKRRQHYKVLHPDDMSDPIEIALQAIANDSLDTTHQDSIWDSSQMEDDD